MALRNLTRTMCKLTMHDEAVRSLQIAQWDARILAISKLRKLAKRPEHIPWTQIGLHS